MVMGLALIVAIGAQNAFVLRQGLRREHVGVVVAICTLADIGLILTGTLGIGVLVTQVPWLLVVLRYAGAAYLLYFAFTSFRSALRSSGLTAQAPRSRASVVGTTLAITFLNPHVYLDTVVMLGSLANQYGTSDRWIFAAGACLGSILWFSALGFGAHRLSGVLGRPAVWRVLDVLIGLVMLALAVKLLVGF
ncbi:MAG: LysE/ArgO family amino acid transporter [Micrococcus sp.]|nr:LysE/ArgO family amino acid transporter [Micrococcus sp.]